MEYMRSLRTGIMAAYPVMSTLQGTYVRIEQTSEAIRVTYEICGGGWFGARIGIENRCFRVMYWHFEPQNTNKHPNYRQEETSRVTCVTLVLWVGNETLHWTLRERPLRTESENPYRITPIHWLMARRRLWRNDVVRSYWRTRHPLLRFLCRKESCRQREELGSKRSVSFPTQRTRVTQVTRDVLFHR